MDFKDLKAPRFSRKAVDPEEIFRQLPRRSDSINDLWRGQTDVLRDWHKRRETDDVLISLNTGAGKTIVGLLIAQSLVNEGIENVVYVCSTIDLVEQTAREGERLGLRFTRRVRKTFDNTLYETGQGFCVTTYQAVFQPFSVFIKNKRIGAIILDDAHTAGSQLRDAFTLRITRSEHNQVFSQIVMLLESAFRDMNRVEQFKDIVSGATSGTVLAPPIAIRNSQQQLIEILKSKEIQKDLGIRLPWEYIKDHLSFCCFIFSKGELEISPPFLPISHLSVFHEKGVRRVYLSASLNHQSDFARAFGRIPTVVAAPNNDAGEGERLILFSTPLGADNLTENLARTISGKHKLLIAVPSYARAITWSSLAVPPDREAFTNELNLFRKAKKGAFVLVFRMDGIDLPDDTCRIMLIDGLPTGASLLERFQLERLNFHNHHSSRLASRLVQLFGRINRGRRDYGVFLISGRDANTWLSNPRNLALLPALLRRQILLGQSVQEQLAIASDKSISQILSAVLNRDQQWVDFYSSSINQLEIDSDEKSKADEIEDKMTKAALAEAECGTYLWKDRLDDARSALETKIEEVARGDPRIAGWFNLWIGSILDFQGDRDSADREYDRARSRLGPNLVLPTYRTQQVARGKASVSPLVARLQTLISETSPASYDREMRLLRRGLAPLDSEVSTPRQNEEAVRSLGEILGFDASRPDNDGSGGPDVLWKLSHPAVAISFELKTDKKSPSQYNSDDISKGHNYIQWMRDKFPDHKHFGLIFVGPQGNVSPNAHPSSEMHWCPIIRFAELGRMILAAVDDIRKRPPVGRYLACEEFEANNSLNVEGIFRRLATRLLKSN